MSNLKRATDLSKNTMIRACAGAGKTYALTKLYINTRLKLRKRRM